MNLAKIQKVFQRMLKSNHAKTQGAHFKRFLRSNLAYELLPPWSARDAYAG